MRRPRRTGASQDWLRISRRGVAIYGRDEREERDPEVHQMLVMISVPSGG